MAVPRAILIGIDEAGYGPKLGPLVIGGTVWDFPAKLNSDTLASLLFPAFQPKPVGQKPEWIPLGDSKVIYQPGQIQSLRFGVQCLLELSNSRSLREYTSSSSSFSQQRVELPWCQPGARGHTVSNSFVVPQGSPGSCLHEESLNLFSNDFQWSGVSSLLALGKRSLASQGIRLLSLHAKIIDEQSFNALLKKHGNKANLLSFESVQLVQAICKELGDSLADYERIEIQCDKHGGRNRYVATVLGAWPELWLEVTEETSERSVYKARWESIPMHWLFQSKGDAMVAPGAASMVAKWKREVLMAKFNWFWLSKLPELRPTAGYPEDAERFWSEIAPIAQTIGIRREDFWRER